jgi:hypothetical protein
MFGRESGLELLIIPAAVLGIAAVVAAMFLMV